MTPYSYIILEDLVYLIALLAVVLFIFVFGFRALHRYWPRPICTVCSSFDWAFCGLCQKCSRSLLQQARARAEESF